MTDDREPVAVGIDVGGTKLVAAGVDRDGLVGARIREETPAGDPDQLMAALAAIVADLGGSGLPVGLGIAGIVDAAGVLRYGANLDVRDFDVGPRLQALTGRPVTVVNDATGAVWGEVQAGAGRGVDDVVMFTLGTGVGGGVVVGGSIVEGSQGFAGELGHLIVEEGGRRCPCGNRGCLEAYSSGTAVALRARARIADEAVSSSLQGHDDLTGKAVAEAALAGDRFAVEMLEEAGRWLGVGIATVVNALDPARILVGGGASIRSASFMLPPAREVMRERLLGGDQRTPPEVVEAELSDDAGMVGAGLLAAERA